MKKLLLLLMSTAAVYTAPPVPTHNLLILLDYGQSEEQLRIGAADTRLHAGTPDPLGALTSTVLPALYQKAAPMLVSTSILKSIMARKLIFQDCLTLDNTQLQRKYAGKKLSRAPSLRVFKQHCKYADTMYHKINGELNNLFKRGSPEEIDKALDRLTGHPRYLEISAPRSLQLYTKKSEPLTQALHRELQIYSLCAYAPLTTKDFCIKKVSNDLTLLIPRSLVSGDSSFTQKKTVTPLEKQLGLKINHLQDIIDVTTFTKEIPLTYTSTFVTDLKKLFVTKQEGSRCVWTLYCSGHGLPAYKERHECKQLVQLIPFYKKLLTQKHPEKTVAELKKRLTLLEKKLTETKFTLAQLPDTHEEIICSMPASEFSKALEFFNTAISTSLLYYTSCYAGGTHLITPYKQGNKDKAFSYDIIVGSVSDTVSKQLSPMLLLPPYRSTLQNEVRLVEGITKDSFDPQKKSLIPRTFLRYKSFFSEAKKKIRKPSNLTSLLHPYITAEGSLKQETIENIAHYRPAGATTFTLADKRPALYTPSTSCTIPSSADVLFLSQHNYATLSVAQKMPQVISLIPGKAMHTIDLLRASNTSLANIVASSLSLPRLSSCKVFWIKKLECKKERRAPLFLPHELQRQSKKGSIVLYDVIIVRNVLTSNGIQNHATSGLYFSDAQGRTWYSPISGSVGTSKRVSKTLAHSELSTLFKNLN